MGIISFLELFFNCGYLYIRCADTSTAPLSKTIMVGVTYSVSLISDLCVLALTAAERYAVLCWPQQMKNLSPKTGLLIRCLTGVVISVIGFVRIQYVFYDLDNSVSDLNYLPKESKTYRESIYEALSIFGDMILPFILVFTMLFFSIKIICVIWKRKKKKLGNIVPATTNGDNKGFSTSDRQPCKPTPRHIPQIFVIQEGKRQFQR